MHRDISLSGHLVRRILHFAFATVLVYYLVPPVMARIGAVPITRDLVLAALYLVAVLIEAVRLGTKRRWFLLHRFETDRIASWFFFSSGAVLLIFTTPQYIAAPVILAVSFADPVIGELRGISPYVAMIGGFGICFGAFGIFRYPLATNALGSLSAVLAESIEPGQRRALQRLVGRKRPWGAKRNRLNKLLAFFAWDDDLLMQLVPAAVIVLISALANAYGWSAMLPPQEPLLTPLY